MRKEIKYYRIKNVCMLYYFTQTIQVRWVYQLLLMLMSTDNFIFEVYLNLFYINNLNILTSDLLQYARK